MTDNDGDRQTQHCNISVTVNTVGYKLNVLTCSNQFSCLYP